MGEVVGFFVPGVVVAQGRPRAFAVRGGHIRMYDPVKSKGWKHRVALFAQQARQDGMPWDGPIALSLIFYLSRPKSVSIKKRKHPTVRPDLDNLEKAVKDGLTGILYVDDAQIVRTDCEKQYADGHPLGVAIKMNSLK